MVYVKKWFAKKKIGFIRIRKKVDNIEEILNLKKQNPKLTKEIKRFATNPRDATNDVDAIKAFVECIKVHPKKKNEILQFAKNKQLSGSHIKELFALMEKEPQKKKDIVQLALENNFSYQAIIHNLKSFEKYPRMKKILLGDTVKYDFIDKVDTILSLKTIRKRNFVYSIIQQKSNPENLKELQKILGDSYSKIKWESLADTKFSKAEIDILLKKIIERSKSFTRMESLEKYYPKDGAWATAMEQITGKAEIRMTNGENFRAIIDNIAYDTNVYSKSVDRAITNKKNMRGILRKGSDIFSSPYGPVAYDKEFFTEYVSRFDDVRNIYKGKKPSPYPNLEITQVDYSGYGKTLIHPKAYSFSTNKNNILTGFEYAEKKYNELIPLIKKVQNGTKLKQDEIENAKAQIAEMTFILTNIMPYERGSANISNMFVRGLYKSLNLESPTIKKGVGLDLEAFILNLDEYILKWDTFFE